MKEEKNLQNGRKYCARTLSRGQMYGNSGLTVLVRNVERMVEKESNLCCFGNY